MSVAAPSPAAERIGLSQWYARFTPDQSVATAGESGECVRLGPIAVYQPDEGCEIAIDGSSEQRLDVLFDGYVFDRRSLCAELGCAHDAGQAQLVALAYRRWGTGLFDRLDGCYLAAVWDEASSRLTLGHDALGRHPLFYSRGSGSLYFGGNVLSLAASGQIPQQINRLSIALELLLFWPETGQTFFESIRRVRPGHYLVVDRGLTIHDHTFWEPIPADDEPWLTPQAVHDEFEPALMSAVARCMELEPQGIMLSGGVDSVTVAALAAQYGGVNGRTALTAVCGRTGGPLSYEEEMQSRVIERLQMAPVISTTGEWREGREGVGLSLELTRDLPGPDATWWVGTYTRFYRRTARQRLHTLLTGAGGDNWLGVADTYAADLLGSLDVREWLRFVRSSTSTGGASLRPTLGRLAWSSGLRPHVDTLLTQWMPDRKQRYHRGKWQSRLPAWLCPDPTLREELIDRLLARRSPGLTASGRRPRSYYRHYLRALDNPYLHHELETAFHIESWCGLRLLSPYHDRRLVSFLNRIPPETLIHGSRYKGLLRPLVAKYLPNLGLEDQRKHYPKAEQDKKRQEVRLEMALAWSSEPLAALDAMDLVDAQVVQREIGAIEALDFTGLARAYVLMSAERWVQGREAA
jgi:asparagine synthetase B (glutamine-hydrolysing)